MSDDTRYPLYQRLRMKSDAAMARGNVEVSSDLAGAAAEAHWQQCLTDYERRKAERDGGRGRERELEA